MTSITDYINQIKIQQAIEVLYPKQDLILNSFYLPYTEEEAYQYIINLPFSYLSYKYINNIFYWEFVNINNSNNFGNLQFVYIRESEFNFNRLKEKIPYYYSWGKNKEIKLIYPKKEYLIKANAVSWGTSYLINISSGFSHKFLPTLEFTGRICLINNNLLYEYRDIKGYYFIKDEYYLSPLRPNNLNYPLGIPKENQLVEDECGKKDLYSNSGDSYFVGEYRNKYTNVNYNPHIKFYLYGDKRREFLLQEPPKIDYKNVALSVLDIEVHLRLLNSKINQTFIIKQNSVNKLIIS